MNVKIIPIPVSWTKSMLKVSWETETNLGSCRRKYHVRNWMSVKILTFGSANYTLADELSYFLNNLSNSLFVIILITETFYIQSLLQLLVLNVKTNFKILPIKKNDGDIVTSFQNDKWILVYNGLIIVFRIMWIKTSIFMVI